MRFWDSSALVPLVVHQEATDRTLAWLEADAEVAVWAFTAVEIVSGIYRLVREGAITETGARAAEAQSEALLAAAHVVRATEAVKSTAVRLLRVHALRAADAFQLAAALTWAGGDPAGRTVCTFDGRLAQAARREGFDLLPEDA